MPAHYAPIPSAQYSTLDAERELDDAFEDDEDEQLESTPLTRTHDQSPVTHRPTPTPGTYDFERDYDQPPPGSPPGPSALALPGNNWGNSNGMIPEEPVRQSFPRPSFFRRALGNILPTHYAPLPTDSNSGIRAGSGMENDGVFANVTAKPTRARTITTDTGEVHVVPEDSARDAPPVSQVVLDMQITDSFGMADLCRCASRHGSSLLGDHCARTRRWRHSSGRPSHGHCLCLRRKYFHILLLPIRWLCLDVPAAHLTRCQIWLACRAGIDPYPIRVLFALSRRCRLCGRQRWVGPLWMAPR